MFSHIFTRRKDQAPAAQPAKAVDLLPKFRRIVVPASGAPFSQRALKTACRLACGTDGAEVRLVYFMEVPRAFALAASLPGEEALADRVLTDGMHTITAFGCTAHSEVQRGRDVAAMLLKYAAQQDVDLLVLGARPDGVRGLPLDLARDIYDRAPCQVILDYIAGDQNNGLANQTSEAATAAAS